MGSPYMIDDPHVLFHPNTKTAQENNRSNYPGSKLRLNIDEFIYYAMTP